MLRHRAGRRVVAAAAVAVALCAASPASPGLAAERLAGPFPARVERVIDGDSLAVRVEVWPGLEVATIVRLRGIDAPELAGRCPAERRRAQAARAALAGLVADGRVVLAGVETDKYGGRVVADVSAPDPGAPGAGTTTASAPDLGRPGGRPLAAALVEAGLARPYDGGRRGGWCP